MTIYLKKLGSSLYTYCSSIFKLKRIKNFDLLDMNPQGERIYSTDNFKHIFWILERKLLIEKLKK
jgi:hypothetical protein